MRFLGFGRSSGSTGAGAGRTGGGDSGRSRSDTARYQAETARGGAAPPSAADDTWTYPHNLKSDDGVIADGRPAIVDQAFYDPGQDGNGTWRGTVWFLDGQTPRHDNVDFGSTAVERIDPVEYLRTAEDTRASADPSDDAKS